MRNLRYSLVLGAVLPALFFAVVLSGDGIENPRPDRAVRPLVAEMPTRDGATRRAPVVSAATPLLDAILLAEYDFDDAGLPDPQGWVSEDVLAPKDTFFHFDDFSGLGPGLAPINGTKSLWCGTADTITYCTWYSLPGYGDYWDQYFENLGGFKTAGDVSLTFNYSHDCDTYYDTLFVEFKDKDEKWQVWASFTGTGAGTFSETLPADTLAEIATFRFHFVSDGGWSDEDGLYDSDGAVIIDDIAVYDDTGLIYANDFEGETVGAVSTLDGSWHGYAGPGFGDYAGLVDADTVVQEDPLTTNTSHVWGFFNGSTDMYVCGGFPAQQAVPLPVGTGVREKINNRIHSPWISLGEDIHGGPLGFTPAALSIELDTYMDNPLLNELFFQAQIRYLVDGCVTDWFSDGYARYWAGDPGWMPWRFVREPYPGATHAQVAVRVLDMHPFAGGPGDCHSHAPLIDNVSFFAMESTEFLVTSKADSGPGSLRQAILNANANPGTDVIQFGFSAPYTVITLIPDTPLPAITDPVVIDGYSQISSSPNTSPPGTAGDALILIELSGYNIGPGSGNHGLVLEADGCTVRGLAIHSFGGSAIYSATSGGHLIEGNHIGTDAAGTAGPGNQGGYAIYMGTGDGSTIGGSDPGARNVISGNDSAAVYIGGDGNLVQGNLIGADATGAVAMGNGEGGIRIAGTGNTVGGTTAAARNVISANGLTSLVHCYGIEIRSPGSGNIVQGNYIGTDITGTAAMGNINGMALDSSPDNIVGGSAEGAGNVISGGQKLGLGIWWSGATGNVVEGNLIGTDATGTLPLGNIEDAIRIYEAPGNTIGGTSSGAGNVIAHTTGGNGVTVQGDGATGNSILSNSIHSNNYIGIELGYWDGVTPNDSLDLDTGPNGLQNFPVLTGVLDAGSQVEGALHSAPLTQFTVQLFSSSACHPDGHGDGETLVASTTVTTDAAGDAPFLVTLPEPLAVGTYLAATATGPDGSTSEFSACLEVTSVQDLFEYAVIDSIVDMPGDQGGWARMHFTRSQYDHPLETGDPIAGYDVHRRTGGSPGTWEVVRSISAQQQPHYICTVPTNGDSASTIPWTDYYVSAHTTVPSVYYDSPPDSGYSVDNLAPAPPAGLAVEYNTGFGNRLTWEPSPEEDFDLYRVYRGTDAGFTPGPENLAAETSSPEWTDTGHDAGGVYYKVTALDHVANESAAAAPSTATGADIPGIPDEFALHQNVPNPFNPSTTIIFDLPRPAHVSLAVYNVKGELIATLMDRRMSEGRREVRWEGRDNGGSAVNSGVYFYRLIAGDFVETRKMILLR